MRQNQRPTLILAKSVTEANRYARVAGLPRFQYRAIRSAGSIRATRNADIHLLSSFLKRPDRHAIIGALRHTRCDVYFVDLADFDLEPKVEDPRGDLTERQLDVAYRYNALLDVDLTDEVVMPLPTIERIPEPEPKAPIEEPKARRRSRCKDCNTLHFPDEACPTATDFFGG